MLEHKVIVVTGGARGIGRHLAEGLTARGAQVAVMDRERSDTACPWFHVGDLSRREDIEAFARGVVERLGGVDGIVHNAMASRGGYPDCSFEDFLWAQAVGVAAPYYLTTLLAPHFRPGASVVHIASTRAFQSQAGTESYSAAKGGIVALTHALAVSLAGKARVNAIAPGWIDTSGSSFEGADALQHPVGRVGHPEDILQAAMFLLGPESSFITGQTLAVDGGMSRLMVYHGDQGWHYAQGQDMHG